MTHVYAASCWDADKDEWVIQKVFLAKCEAIEFAVDATKRAARCNQPIEWWRVEEYHLTPCSGKSVVWGCPAAVAGDC